MAKPEYTDDGTAPVRPTLERLAKGGVSANPADPRTRIARPWAADSAMIDVYRNHQPPLISDRQWKAGDTFARIWHRASGSPWRTQSWTGRISGDSNDMAESMASAKQQIAIISDRMTANMFSALVNICGLHHSATGWARDRGMHPSVGLPMLRETLDLYAKHLGLPED